MNKELALKNLKIVKKVFDKHEVDFYLTYGTALGIYRDMDFLPDDHDIDLGVFDNSISLKTRKSIGWMLYDLGFFPADIAFNIYNRYEPVVAGYSGDEKSGIIVCEKDGIEFTIFFFYEEDCEKHGREYVCVPALGAMKLISTQTKYYKKPEKITFHKDEYLIPSPVEDYFEFTYEDWKNPMKRDHGLTYFEMHPEHLEVLKNVMDKNQVYHAVKKNE